MVLGSIEYVTGNLPQEVVGDRGVKHLSTGVLSPYNQKSSQVRAKVRIRVRTFFGRIVGLPYVDIERRAVAEQQSGQGEMAIYTNSIDCDPDESLQFGGQNMHIDGWVHSEGGIYVSVARCPAGLHRDQGNHGF